MNDVKQLAKIIWDYHHVNQPIAKSDCILVLGSYDLGPAQRGIDLFLSGYAEFIIFSGGLGRHTEKSFDQPEADVFAEMALKRGVPKEKIIVENKSTNTGDNVRFTRKLLEQQGFDFESFILVQKPYMGRRTFATFKKLWPDKKFCVTSPEITFEEYIQLFPMDEVINIMVGDLQRIVLYPAMRYQIPQEIPPDVMQAYQELIKLGYNKELIKQ
jgi:uncharacterized SAM-binding protein YcdF (DUF218 family)